MKNILFGSVSILFFISALSRGDETGHNYASPDEAAKNGSKVNSKDINDVEFFDRGIKFFGNTNFECGDGELSIVSDRNGKEIVPLGAVLCAVKKNYILGYYVGKVSVHAGNDVIHLEKIFFTVHRDGSIVFYYAGKDPNFIGAQITGKVDFE